MAEKNSLDLNCILGDKADVMESDMRDAFAFINYVFQLYTQSGQAAVSILVQACIHDPLY